MRILILDDEPENLLQFEQMAARLGHEAVWAQSAAQALEALDGVDAVVADIHMPEMGGIELAGEIARQGRQIPIVFATGSSPSAEVVRQAERFGKLLPRPFSLPELRAVIGGTEVEYQ